MKRPKQSRKQRKRFFVGCEGESERSYARFLQDCAERQELAIHLDTHLCTAGDPRAIVEEAVSKSAQYSKRHGSYAAKLLFLDSDTRDQTPERTHWADQKITAGKFNVVWSKPCLEALILNHLPGCETLRPSNTALAENELKARWPGYVKAMPAKELSRLLSMEHVRRAAEQHPGLKRALQVLGIV